MRSYERLVEHTPAIDVHKTGFEDAPDTPCDDYYVLDASPDAVVAALDRVPALANHYLTIGGHDDARVA